MYRKLSFLALATAALSLSACAYMDSSFAVDQLNKAQPTGSEFAKQLTEQYKARANDSQDSTQNYEQAYNNALRGLQTAEGQEVPPYAPDQFDVAPEKTVELTAARTKLINTLKTAKANAPKEAALAQAKYDCWVEDAAKDWAPEQYQACQAEFKQAMDQLQGLNAEPVNMTAGAMPPQAQQALNAVPATANQFFVFFTFKGKDLPYSAKETLDMAAQQIMASHPRIVYVIGHSDAAGSKKSKLKISQQRAAAIAASLVTRGVPANIIAARGVGDTMPLVKVHSKGGKEAANRRVEIRLQ